MPPKRVTPVKSDEPTFATFLPSCGAMSETTDDNCIMILGGVKRSESFSHSYDILGARMLWKPKEARILKNFIDQPV
jgi:hypothetical protein